LLTSSIVYSLHPIAVMLHAPMILDTYGYWNTLAPIISVTLAFLPMAAYTFPRNKKVCAFLTAWYIFVFNVARFPVVESSTQWGPETDMTAFAIFAATPFVGIFFFYRLYSKDESIKDMLHSCPAEYICAHQIYRFGGAIFMYLYTEKGLKSYSNLQTGILDIFMGATAIPMYLYVKGKKLEDVKSVLLAWHAIGLFDLGSAFTFASIDFFGIYKYDYSPAVWGYMPVTLICYFQVAWAIGIHTLYLTSFDALAAAQGKTEKKQ
jgi:hypothetical protein